MTSITLIMLIIAIAILAFHFMWSSETVENIYEVVDLAYINPTMESMYALQQMDDEYVDNLAVEEEIKFISNLPVEAVRNLNKSQKGKKNISSIIGEWGRVERTTYHKGLTLHSYRMGEHLRKKIMHPCVCGGKSECFD